MTSYCTEIKVRFGDEDRAGVVYFPRYFDFFHRAFEDFLEDHGHPFRVMIETTKLGWPVVRADADFKAPLHLGDRVAFELTFSHVGRRSATIHFRGRKATDDVLAVEGSTTVVCVDPTTFESKPIPDDYDRLFRRYLSGEGEQ